MKHSIVIFGLLIFSLVLTIPAQEQTTDGGYIVGGSSESYRTGTIPDSVDFILYKLNGSGAIDWFNNYGGVMWDYGLAARQTADGGYIMVGVGDSYSFPVPNVEIFKLDAGGAVEWRRSHSVDDFAVGWDIRQTADGGYAVVGETGPMYGTGDMLLMKLDATGNKQWQKIYGGSGWEEAYSLDLTADGGYIIAGVSSSFSHGQEDFLVYKLNSSGNKQWRKNYGGIYGDGAFAVRQTSDGGYIVAGVSSSYAHGPTGMIPFNDADFLVYKIDAAGNKQWRKNYGGTRPDWCMSVEQTSDGGYILAGESVSYASGYTGGWPFMPHDLDFLVYKLNASGQKQWRKNFGGMLPEFGGHILQAGDGGYLLAGTTLSYTHGDNSGWPFGPSDSDILVYKLNAAGQKQWRKNYGGTEEEWGPGFGF